MPAPRPSDDNDPALYRRYRHRAVCRTRPPQWQDRHLRNAACRRDNETSAQSSVVAAVSAAIDFQNVAPALWAVTVQVLRRGPAFGGLRRAKEDGRVAQGLCPGAFWFTNRPRFLCSVPRVFI